MQTEERPSLREKLREAATGEMLDAAETLMVRKGVDGATMQEIATAAGCAAGTLYLHFRNKEAMLDAIIVRHARAMFASAHAALQQGEDSLEKIRCGMLAHFRYIDTRREFFRFFFEVNPFRSKGLKKKAGPEAWAVREEYQEAALKCLRDAQKKALVRRDIPAETIQRSLDAMGMEFADEFVQSGSKQSAEELCDIIWGIFLNGIGGTSHAKK